MKKTWGVRPKERIKTERPPWCVGDTVDCVRVDGLYDRVCIEEIREIDGSAAGWFVKATNETKPPKTTWLRWDLMIPKD